MSDGDPFDLMDWLIEVGIADPNDPTQWIAIIEKESENEQ